MKLPDTEVLQYDEYFVISDTWKLEWERGVQVPVDPDGIPDLVVRSVTACWAGSFVLFYCFCTVFYCKMVKLFRTRLQTLGPELIMVYRQSANLLFFGYQSL